MTTSANVANHIGDQQPLEHDVTMESIIDGYKKHESIENIRKTVKFQNEFSFQEVNSELVCKLMSKMNPKKATGYDGIPNKLVKIAADEIAPPLTSLINTSMKKSVFPDRLKLAEISPVYKCKDILERGNYRSVSILPSLSKIFEKIYFDQLYEHFNMVLSIYISAFRKHYGCHHVLTNLVEKCKEALDHQQFVGIIAMDLSKAFDCLSHRLLLCKLKAYGVSDSACALIKSYLYKRQQRVKIGPKRSEWGQIAHGIPQGSILGPLLFNIFINDLFYKLENICSLFNYADDNSLVNTSSTLISLQRKLEVSANVAIHWFKINYMQANPEKFQAMVLKHDPAKHKITLDGGGTAIPTNKCIKLLGVHVDCKLNFDKHVSTLCARAGKQICAINRIAKYLSVDCLLNIYYAFIIASFEYYNIVWHFCSKENAMKIEKIHKKALRVVLNNYDDDYPALLNTENRPSCFLSRIKSIL